MQHKNKQKLELKKQIRHAHERMAAAMIAGAMVVGVVAVSSEARRLMTELAVRPTFAVVEHSIRETETGHRSMRLDSALRAPNISGL